MSIVQVFRKWREKRRIKAFSRTVDRFIKADKNEQKQALSRLIKAIEKGGLSAVEKADRQRDLWKVFPEYSRDIATITFSETETNEFSEPFRTLFQACGSTARVIKKALTGGGKSYEIRFRRYGYNVESGEQTSIEQAKAAFRAAAKVVDICE